MKSNSSVARAKRQILMKNKCSQQIPGMNPTQLYIIYIDCCHLNWKELFCKIIKIKICNDY